ncbi:MAG: hypothetical protein ACLP5H_31225 [Desulfomonilaceae bacterium]
MKKLVLSLTLMAFILPAGFVLAGGGEDGNRDSLRQAWKAVQAEEKKAAAAAKDLTEKATAALASLKANTPRRLSDLT